MYEYRAEITHIIDGDTIDVQIDLGFHVSTLQRLRLVGIDTPERDQSGYLEAKDFTARYKGEIVTIKTTKTDKYGRYLADVILDSGESLNQLLLDNKLARVY